MLEKINDGYCDFCIGIYFGILKFLKLDYFLIHNIQ